MQPHPASLVKPLSSADFDQLRDTEVGRFGTSVAVIESGAGVPVTISAGGPNAA